MKYLKSTLSKTKSIGKTYWRTDIAKHRKENKCLDFLVSPKYTKIWNPNVRNVEKIDTIAKITMGKIVLSKSVWPCSMYTVLGIEGTEINKMPMAVTITTSTSLYKKKCLLHILEVFESPLFYKTKHTWYFSWFSYLGFLERCADRKSVQFGKKGKPVGEGQIGQKLGTIHTRQSMTTPKMLPEIRTL